MSGELEVLKSLEGDLEQAPTTEPKGSDIPPVTDNGGGSGNDDEDLEDGEIDDDDENSGDVVHVTTTKGQTPAAKKLPDIVDLISDNSSAVPSPTVLTTGTAATPTSVNAKQKKKPQPVEDDYAVTIENAIASALKKKGIEPTMPKVLESRNGLQQKDGGRSESPGPGEGQSRSSRRRKRKKQRDDKEKDKDKKRHRYDSTNQPPNDDDDMDDYEMMNVRGGSPPPFSQQAAPQCQPSLYKDYDTMDDSASSNDSYDSAGGNGMANDRRRSARAKKETPSRKRRDRGGRGGGRDDDDFKGNNRQDKRNRRDSADDKHRQEPRKLELCKFYLMECCAKRDKCSYMHGDFPCKFYYLGMDCVPKDGPCKFSHGEPLTEQLRNILLKHLETAPKEILGNFKRISRESAISQITQRHGDLCKQFDVENTWTGVIMLPHVRRGPNAGAGIVGGNVTGGGGENGVLQQQQQQLQQQQQTLTSNTTTTTTTTNNQSATPNIPSLLDMVIKPPPQLAKNDKQQQQLQQQQRKSRWTEGADGTSGGSVVNKQRSTGAKYLDLANLHGVVSDEHIDKLSQLGIKNLEQVNQLTFGQMNEIGLTIAEIGEIQKIAQKGATKANNDAEAGETNSSLKDSKATDNEKDHLVSANSNSNGSSGVVFVDYSQYLKDSHLSYDRADNYDDERDDEQLVIDDGNTDNEEPSTGTPEKTPSEEAKNFQPQPPKLQMADLSQSLKGSLNTLIYSSNVDKSSNRRDPRSSFQVNDDDMASGQDTSNSYTAPRDRRRRSRSVTPTRSQSSTPEAIQSPEPDGQHVNETPSYERSTMYDCSALTTVDEDVGITTKGDKDMRYELGGAPPNTLSDIDLRLPFDGKDKDMRVLPNSSNSFSDIDLRLPFQPVLNYTPATEIDGSIASHLPVQYKAYEIEIRKPAFAELRKSFKSDDTTDPRLRRILGLPELQTPQKNSTAGKRTDRKLSNTIASPESSDGASPMYYTPPPLGAGTQSTSSGALTSSSSASVAKEKRKPAAQPRMDPRRAAKQNAANSSSSSPSASSPSIDFASNASGSGGATCPAVVRQIDEIRAVLHKSDWYKNLNSKFKIMVNQQLALVSTELKKFYQNPAANKIFDISFIVNNGTLQQILTNLGIYIDDNGEVARVDADSDDNMQQQQQQQQQNNMNNMGGGNGGAGGLMLGGISLPNLSQPPPLQPQLDFLRAPPPNMGPPLQMFRPGGGGGGGNMGGPANQMNMPAFAGPSNNRPSLLGVPPVMGGGGNNGGGNNGGGGGGLNPFNPFVGNNMQDNMSGGGGANFGGVNLLGPGGAGPFVANAFNALLQANLQQQQQQQQQLQQQQQQQRNFANMGGGGGNNQRNQQRQQQQNRRNNFGGK